MNEPGILQLNSRLYYLSLGLDDDQITAVLTVVTKTARIFLILGFVAGILIRGMV